MAEFGTGRQKTETLARFILRNFEILVTLGPSWVLFCDNCTNIVFIDAVIVWRIFDWS